MIKIKLPEKPVDGYKLEWYRLSVSDIWCYIHRVTATYHLNTPWARYSKEKVGVDLIDDWMIAKDGCDEGRSCGWSTIAKTASWQETSFPTYEEAKIAAIDKLTIYKGGHQSHIDSIDRMIEELRTGKEQ